MFDWLVASFTNIIETLGYGGVFLLMIGESMILPVPSEAVMPFAGFLIFSGEMSWFAVMFWSTLGSLVGSGLSYFMGSYGGRVFVLRLGKYFFLNEHHLQQTEKFFAKYGIKTVFISRFIPVVRHLISIPAGVAKMNLWKFSFYTLIGATLWNGFLTYCGVILGAKYDVIKGYSKYLDYLIVVVLFIFLSHWVFKQIKKRNGSKS